MSIKEVTNENINELIEAMKYSFLTIEEECRKLCGVEFGQLNYEHLTKITYKIFQCSCCNYWFSNDFCIIREDEENWCEDYYEERNNYDDI